MIFFLKFRKMNKESISVLRMQFWRFYLPENMENPQVPLNVKIKKICEIHQKCWKFSKSANFDFFSLLQKRTQKSTIFIFSPEKMAQFFFLDSELTTKSYDKITKSEKYAFVKIFKLLGFINTFWLRIWRLEGVSHREWDKRKFSLNFFSLRKKEML